MRQILSVLVENSTGVLARVAGMFARRGYNIESLTVSNTDQKDVSRMTIVVDGDDKAIEQVTKQMHKLIEVLRISNITGEEYVDRELVLIKILTKNLDDRNQIMQIVDVYRGHIVDISRESLIIELTGNSKKLDAFEETLRPFGLKEVVRTGQAAIVRGSRSKLV